MKYASVLTYALIAGLLLGSTLALQAGKATSAKTFAVPSVALLTQPTKHANSKRLQQRANYRLALKDLAKNRITEFKRRQQQLRDYTLAPYLEYHYRNKTVDKITSKQMASFRTRFADYPFTERLRDRWLLKLPSKGRWADYLANYEPSNGALRRCYYLRSLYRSGQRKAALDQVAPLWLHGKSQPKGCDALFEAWIGAGYLNDKLVWQRLNLALDRNEVTLANYLLRLMKPGTLKKQATALYKAHVRPQTQFNPGAFSADTQTNRTILQVGVQRLARKDPAAATALWRNLKQSHDFAADIQTQIEGRLLIEGSQESLYPPAHERPQDLTDSALERIAREAVRQQNWPQAAHWISEMTSANRAKSEWQYWARRSAGSDLGALAQERNYYGFLAARDVGVDTRLNHQPSANVAATLASVSELPSIDRALELHAVDDLINARREWRAAFSTLSSEQKVAAARLAQQYGWLDQAIIAANAASLHNDLDLRFPQVFSAIYGKASSATNIPPSTLLAITRQESAFQQRARSHANARGLMQLLPATAKRTARKAGLRQPSTLDLYKPEINIRIASEYFASLMTRYNQQRPLAFAAYNAGERRVDRWIKDRAGMPMEVWIETIPFKETRGYVKSVLAFNHLYSKRMNNPVPLLMAHEVVVN